MMHLVSMFGWVQSPVILNKKRVKKAACIEGEGNFDQEYRSLKAKPDLKQKVWQTDSIHEALETGMFDEILKQYIVPKNLNQIYKHIPEAEN